MFDFAGASSIESAHVSLTKPPPEENVPTTRSTNATSASETTTINVTVASIEIATNASTAATENASSTAEATSPESTTTANGTDSTATSILETISTPSSPIANSSCNGQLVFEIVEPDPDVSKAVNFSDMAPGSSASDCARLCYERGCVVAGFAPISGNYSAACLLSFDGQPKCGQESASSDYNGTKVIEIHCVKCNAEPQPAIEAQPALLTKGPLLITGFPPTRGPEPQEVRRCIEELSFSISPSPSTIVAAKVTSVKTARACAAECYAHGCTQAVFRPNNFHTSEFDALAGYPCSLSFEPAICTNETNRVNDTTSVEPALIACVHCGKRSFALVYSNSRTSEVGLLGLAEPILVPSNESEAQNSTSEIPEATTEATVVNGTTQQGKEGSWCDMRRMRHPFSFCSLPNQRNRESSFLHQCQHYRCP